MRIPLLRLTQWRLTQWRSPLHPWRSARPWLGALALILALVLPVRALGLTISPKSPRLGDTVVVQVTSPAAPTVRYDNTSYPAFPFGAPGTYRALIPTTPLDRPGPKTIEVSTQTERQQATLTLAKRSFRLQNIWLKPGADSNDDPYEFDRVDAFKAIVSPEKYWNGALRRPNAGEISSEFGVRRNYNGVLANDYYHRGVDYAGGYGSPIVAPAAGRIALVGYAAKGFKVHGNVVGIDHGQGLLSIMLHMSRIDVREGQMVTPGQVIGALGSTGAATGPHLHWGLYVNGKAVDPAPWREGNIP
jgi:murein DD-endopeptidase MepM/ murein hydrolase activator NlpD